MREIDSLLKRHSNLIAANPDPISAARVDFRYDNSQNIRRGSSEFPDISVIIPAYNESARIERVLASLNQALAETPLPTEVIVVDNNSTDQTAEMAEDFGVTVVREPLKGVANARQGGLEATNETSTYVLNTDADCLVSPDWIRRHQTALVDPEACYSYGPVSLFLDQKASLKEALSFQAYLIGLGVVRGVKKMALNYVPMTGQNCGYKREQALSTGGYRRELAAHEDLFLCLDVQQETGGKSVDSRARVWSSGRRIVQAGVFDYAVSRLTFNFNYYIAGQQLEKPVHYEDYR